MMPAMIGFTTPWLLVALGLRGSLCGNSSAAISSCSGPRIRTRSMTLRSWRTLPGQGIV